VIRRSDSRGFSKGGGSTMQCFDEKMDKEK
jgi:hypothetical protein